MVEVATKRTAPGRRGWRWWLMQAHLWAGLILCLPFVMLGVTGSILTFHHELEALTDPLPRAADGPSRSIGEIAAAARAKAPEGFQPSLFFAPEHAGDPATVRLAQRGAPPGPGGLVARVDPVTLAVLDLRDGTGGWLRQIRLLHANLLIRDRTGREIIGWLGVVMCGLGVTGLVLWWPRRGQWGQAFGVRRGARGLRLHRELHGAVGIWSLLVFMIVCVSGTYLAFPQTMAAAVAAVAPTRDLRAVPTIARPAEGARGGRPASPDDIVALAREAVPDGRLRMVALGGRPDQATRVGLLAPGAEPGAPMISVFVDPWARRVVEVRDPRRYTASETLLAWQHALHAGEGLGPIWQGLVFLSGFLPPLFVVTGISMWWLKRRARRALDARRSAALEAAE